MTRAIAILVVLLASCSHKDPTLLVLADFTRRACACPDQACTIALGKELDAWLDEHHSSPAGSPEEREMFRDQGSHQLNAYENCAQRFDPFYVPWGPSGLKTGHAIGGPRYDISPAIMEAANREVAAADRAPVDAAVPIAVTEVPMEIGGRKIVKTLASCDRLTGSEGDDCRQLFADATKCHTDPPAEGSDACVAYVIADWIDDHPDAAR